MSAVSRFTPEELETLRLYDNMIDSCRLNHADYESEKLIDELLFPTTGKRYNRDAYREHIQQLSNEELKEIQDKRREYAKANREEIRKRKQAWYQKNRERIQAQQRAYRMQRILTDAV